jgi:hypothetical protein
MTVTRDNAAVATLERFGTFATIGLLLTTDRSLDIREPSVTGRQVMGTDFKVSAGSWRVLWAFLRVQGGSAGVPGFCRVLLI